MLKRHERRCWDCGHVAMHASDVAPWVNCDRCGSLDTRRTKPREARIVAAVWSDMPDLQQHLACGGWYWCEDLGTDSPPQLLRHYTPLRFNPEDSTFSVDLLAERVWQRWTAAGWVPLVGRVAPCMGRP